MGVQSVCVCVSCGDIQNNGWLGALNMDVFCRDHDISVQEEDCGYQCTEDLCFKCLARFLESTQREHVCVVCEITEGTTDEKWAGRSKEVMDVFMTVPDMCLSCQMDNKLHLDVCMPCFERVTKRK